MFIRGLIFFLSLLSGFAHAGLMISDIRMDVTRSHYTYRGGDLNAAETAFQNGTPVCSLSLNAIDRIGAGNRCGVYRNYAQAFSFNIRSANNMWLQFGTDWGRGGVIFDQQRNATDVLGDTWWRYRYGSGDTINYQTGPINTRLTFLGFEGCCGGASSARYSTDAGQSWETLAVREVPEPSSTLSMVLALGALLLLLRQRRAIAERRSAFIKKAASNT